MFVVFVEKVLKLKYWLVFACERHQSVYIFTFVSMKCLLRLYKYFIPVLSYKIQTT